MRQKCDRHIPFGSVGVVLIVGSVLPTVVAMVSGFTQLQRGEDAATVSSEVALTFRPAFMACGALGVLLVVVALVLALRRRRRAVA